MTTQGTAEWEVEVARLARTNCMVLKSALSGMGGGDKKKEK